ncbi:ribonuclease M5 [Insulibacter thermoxylanivorax]|nr:ribonuclease M5 [Insulibacter thermoxylanivorax]
MIREVIVVEGREDTAAIQRAVEADTIETGGSAINQEIIERIKLAQERRGVIIFTDPDHPGERIRSIISQHVPGCKHAFLPVSEARRKGEVGVEHASPEAIRRALSHVKTEMPEAEPEITMEDLRACGLVIHPGAAARREVMGILLGIGHANGKTFLKRCRIFQITREEFWKAYTQMEETLHE